MKILGISGSLRQTSHNTQLLRVAADLLPPGTELEIFDGLDEVPPFNDEPFADHWFEKDLLAAG